MCYNFPGGKCTLQHLACRRVWSWIVAFLLWATPTASAGVFSSLTIDQYHHFDPLERFQIYVPTLAVGYEGERFSVAAVYNLFNRVDPENGAITDHNITPWTLESYWHVTNDLTVEANFLHLVDVYAKSGQHQIDAMLEAKVGWTKKAGPVRVLVQPSLRIFEQDPGHLRIGIGGGVALGPVTVGVNLLDTKDYYLLGQGRNVATARIELPLSNKNTFVAELHQALGETGRESTWFVYRFDMARLLEF